MRSSRVSLVLRCVTSAGLSVAVVVGATYVPHVIHTTVALLLVLLILGLSIQWGWMEALTASLAGGLAFDYFFLPPRDLEASEHWVTLGAFLLTAILTGQLAARANRYRSVAERRRDEIASLYRLSDVFLDTENAEGPLDRIPGEIVEIFGVRAAALFEQQGGRIFRSGSAAHSIPDGQLHEVAATGNPLIDNPPECCVVPVRQTGNLAGSLGITGALPQSVAEAIAERIGVALARAYAARESMAAELARRSENLKSAVLDALAHEIKGPLATVKVSVTTLLSEQAGNATQQRELLTIIDEEANRIERWIDSATQISRSEAGELRVTKKANSIGKVAAHAMEGLGPLVNGRPMEIRIPESLPNVDFDAGLIEKVIRLLLDNALRYSPAGSAIGVSAEFTGAEVVLSVADCGCGISEDEKTRIFEQHYRGSAAKQGIPGTGLGLASAKCIMEAHSGEIWVTGSPGCGSVFHISLPATMEFLDERSENIERG
jgi:two-component system sensor histidine kinase KdpD